jgi:hypothetical protein
MDTYQERFEAALRETWVLREGQGHKHKSSGGQDVGERAEATGGKHLDPIADLIKSIFVDAGFGPRSISGRSKAELPGHFRPEKRWDLVVMHGPVLAAVIELKSLTVGSVKKNSHNRAEEVVGSAFDFHMAFREGRLGAVRPWLGYLLVLEEEPVGVKPPQVKEPFFKVDPQFYGASYGKRCELLLRRLVGARLYDGACLATVSRNPKLPIHEPADLSFGRFVDAIKRHAEGLLSGEPVCGVQTMMALDWGGD